jgi:hypothetical protein
MFEKCGGKVKVQTDSIPEHLTMKAFWGCGGKVSYNLALRGEWSASFNSHCIPGKEIGWAPEPAI